MAVDPDMVREGLPNRGGSRVSDVSIEAAISAWTKRVTRRAGSEYVEDDEGSEIIRLGATGMALQIYDADISRDSPGTLMIRQASDWLAELDVDTTSDTGESGKIHDDLVSQTVSDDLWTENDFDVPSNRGRNGGGVWLPWG